MSDGVSVASGSSASGSSLASHTSDDVLDPPRFTFGPVPSTQTFAADNGRPWLASVHAGESLLVLGTHAGSVYVLDPTNTESVLVRALKPHSASVQAVATDSAERYVASVGLDGLVSISALGNGSASTFSARQRKSAESSQPLVLTKKKPAASALGFSLPFVPSSSSTNSPSATGDAPAQSESWTYSDGRPLRAIALDPLFHRRTNRAFVTGGNAGTVVMRELSSIASTSSSVGMGQFSLPWLRRSGQGEHVATTLHSSESDGPIWALTWRTHLIAWACDRGVRIYDMAARTKVAFIAPPGPDIQPALSSPHFAWRDKRHLVIGWDKTIKVVRIRPRNARPSAPAPHASSTSTPRRGRPRSGSGASLATLATICSTSNTPPPESSPPPGDASDPPSRPTSGLEFTSPNREPQTPPRHSQHSNHPTGPRLAADVIQILHLDAEVAGVVACGLDLLVLAHVDEDSDGEADQTQDSVSVVSSPIRSHRASESSQSNSTQVESPLELRLISSSGEELNAEPVPLPPHPSGRRRGVTADYALACPGGSCADLDVAAVTAALAQAEAILATMRPEDPDTNKKADHAPGEGEQDADDEDHKSDPAASRSPDFKPGSMHQRASTPPMPPPSLHPLPALSHSTPAPTSDLPAGTDATFYILTPFGLTASHPSTWQNRVDYLLSLNAYEAVLGQLEALGRKYADALGYRWSEIGMMYLYQLVRSGAAPASHEEDDAPNERSRGTIDGPTHAAAQAPSTLARDEEGWEAFVLGLTERASEWDTRHHHAQDGEVQPAIRNLVADAAAAYLSYRTDNSKDGSPTKNPYAAALTALCAHVPIGDPQLSARVYNILFAHLIVLAPGVLRNVVETWPTTAFDVEGVVEALREQRALVQNNPVDSEHLTFALARVYMRTGRPGTALPLLLSVRWPGVFRLIAEYGLFSAVQDLAGELVLFDRDVHRPPSLPSAEAEEISGSKEHEHPRGDGLHDADPTDGEPSKSVPDEPDNAFGASISLLVQHALSITPARVVPQLDALPQRFADGKATVSADPDIASAERDGMYLYLYLASLLHAVSAQPAALVAEDEAATLSPALIAPYADQMIQLAARFNRDTLIIVLRALAEEYDIQKAYQVCLARDFVPEMVLLLGRVGDTKRALELILTRLGDVRRALTFAQEQNDPELWEDLFKYAETRPAYITAILTHGGDSLDAARFITRLADELVIPGLRDALIRLLTAKRRQLDLLSGCADVLAMETGAEAAARQRIFSSAVAGPFTTETPCAVCGLSLFDSYDSNRMTKESKSGSGGSTPARPSASISISGQELDPAIVFLCQHACHLQCCIGGPPRLKASLPSLLASGTQDARPANDLDRIEKASPRENLGLVSHAAAEPWLCATLADAGKEDPNVPITHPPWSHLRLPPTPSSSMASTKRHPADVRRAVREQDAQYQSAMWATLTGLDPPLRPACPLCRAPRAQS